MVHSKVASIKPNVDLVYSVDVNHGEWASTPLWTCTHLSGVMTKLYSLSDVSQASLSEKSTHPFL